MEERTLGQWVEYLYLSKVNSHWNISAIFVLFYFNPCWLCYRRVKRCVKHEPSYYFNLLMRVIIRCIIITLSNHILRRLCNVSIYKRKKVYGTYMVLEKKRNRLFIHSFPCLVHYTFLLCHNYYWFSFLLIDMAVHFCIILHYCFVMRCEWNGWSWQHSYCGFTTYTVGPGWIQRFSRSIKYISWQQPLQENFHRQQSTLTITAKLEGKSYHIFFYI